MSFTSLSLFRPPLFTLAAGRVLGLRNATYDSLSVWCTSILRGVIRPVGRVWFLRWWVFLPRRIESGSQTLVWRLDVCKLSVRGDSNINLTLILRRTSVTIKVQQRINFGWKWKTMFIFPQGAALFLLYSFLNKNLNMGITWKLEISINFLQWFRCQYKQCQSWEPVRD